MVSAHFAIAFQIAFRQVRLLGRAGFRTSGSDDRGRRGCAIQFDATGQGWAAASIEYGERIVGHNNALCNLREGRTNEVDKPLGRFAGVGSRPS